jgi:DNA-binding GntR family transcriptional regulator
LSIRKAFPTRHVADEHQAILSAALSGDADKAADLLSSHFAATAEVLLKDESVFPGAPAEQNADIDDTEA